jgi:hypothetical protein
MKIAANLQAGIDNLLFNCIEANAGESLAIIRERGGGDYYSATLADVIAAHGRNCGLDVMVVDTSFIEDANEFPTDISRAMDAVDHTLFLARIGDQVRFTDLGGAGTKTMCYALDEESVAADCCSADYRFFAELKSLVNSAVFGEKKITITCGSGTNLVGISPPDPGDDSVGDVSLRRFPMTVFRPVPANTFSGRLALSRWLSLTGSRYYQPDSLLIDGVVFALIKKGRIVGFEGNEREVRKIRAHYEFVADKYDIDGDVIHSWHAGIHPQNGYVGLAVDNLTRWSGSAFGNPRYLHFHTCGDYAPGEICISVFDPSITVDGVTMWRDGKLDFADTPEVRTLQANYPGMRELFERPVLEYGLGENQV